MRRPAQTKRREWLRAGVLGVGLFLVYSLNGREIGAGDTIPSLLQPIAVLRGDGLALNRFEQLWRAGWPYPFAVKRGIVLSRYPLGPPLLAVPFTAPQLLVVDAIDPGWEADPGRTMMWARRMGKTSAAAIGALTGVAIFLLLCGLGLESVALPATVITALGSNLWMTGSQSLWQHGPAAFAIASALALLVPPPRQRWRLLLAGGACALLVHSRPHLILVPLLIFAWVLWRYRAQAFWFVILPALLGGALIAYNLWFFGTLMGGYGELVQMVGMGSHGVTQYWGEHVGEGVLGTLLSPSRGLFIFSPWIALSLLALPKTAPALRRWPLICLMFVAVVVLFIQLALQSTWWAGWSFGPRYWTDVLPIFAVPLGFALAWARQHSRPYFATLLAAGAFSIALQAIGAFYYPSSFNARPGNIDLEHERLWSWRDGEIARCLHEGARGWE